MKCAAESCDQQHCTDRPNNYKQGFGQETGQDGLDWKWMNSDGVAVSYLRGMADGCLKEVTMQRGGG